MKNILLIFFLFIGNGDKITTITKANEAKELAEEAFNAKKYDEAIKNYSYLLDSLKYEDPKARLNLAHAYYLSDDSTNSIQSYNRLLTSTDESVKSIAHQQLGAMSEKNNDFKTALAHFKNALKTNPNNKDARYNYELVKKKLEQQQEQNKDKKEDKKDEKEDKKDGDKKDQDKKGDKDDKKKDGEKKDQEEKDQEKKEGDKGEKDKDQEKKDEKGEDEKSEEEKKEKKEKKEKGKDGEPKDEKKDDKSEQLTPEEKKAEEEKANKQAQQQRFEEMKMSPEKAKMILNAMKQGEKQYIQQLQKKGTKQKDSDKPDW